MHPNSGHDDIVGRVLDELKAELDEALLKNYECKKFAPVGAAKRVLDRKRLLRFFKALYNGEGKSNEVLDYFVNRTLGDDRQAEDIQGEDLGQGLVNILATIIYIKQDGSLRAFKSWFDTPLGEDLKLPITDKDLPLKEDKAKSLFKDAWEIFNAFQFIFCPIVITRQEERIYQGHDAGRPLPYLQLTLIGNGASGDVYRAKIAKGHFESQTEGHKMSNPEHIVLAVKEFRNSGRRDYEDEVAVLHEVRESNLSHKNVMMNLGSLVIGNSATNVHRSIFYELADHDLWSLLTEFRGPQNLAEKDEIIERAADLTGGLAFLHDNIGDNYCCYHLDIKPANVLVIKQEGKERWKLTDFNLSCLKKKWPEVRLSRVSVNDISLTRDASSTYCRRGEGTYQAPEVRDNSSKVGRESDLWSMGCTLALVYSYLDNGPEGVKEFNEFRSKGQDTDCFYRPSEHDSYTQVVNPQVSKWFAKLRKNAKERGKQQAKTVDEILSFLERKVIVVDRSERKKTNAKMVEEALRSSMNKLRPVSSASAIVQPVGPVTLNIGLSVEIHRSNGSTSPISISRSSSLQMKHVSNLKVVPENTSNGHLVVDNSDLYASPLDSTLLSVPSPANSQSHDAPVNPQENTSSRVEQIPYGDEDFDLSSHLINQRYCSPPLSPSSLSTVKGKLLDAPIGSHAEPPGGSENFTGVAENLDPRLVLRDRPLSPMPPSASPADAQLSNVSDSRKCTPLCLASFKHNLEAAKNELINGADPNTPCPLCGLASLHIAIQQNKQRDRHKRTPLMIACENGGVYFIVELLLGREDIIVDPKDIVQIRKGLSTRNWDSFKSEIKKAEKRNPPANLAEGLSKSSFRNPLRWWK